MNTKTNVSDIKQEQKRKKDNILKTSCSLIVLESSVGIPIFFFCNLYIKLTMEFSQTLSFLLCTNSK